MLSYLRRDGDELLRGGAQLHAGAARAATASACREAGSYRELLNSDSRYYGGSNLGNGGPLAAAPSRWMGRPFSLGVTLPPLAGIVLRRERG